MRTLLERNIDQTVLFLGTAVDAVYELDTSTASQRNIHIRVTGTNTAGFDVRVLGTSSQDKPDFTAAVTPTNEWSYLQTENNATGVFLAGSVGYTFAADGSVELDVNTDVINWIAVEVFNTATGDVKISVVSANNT